MSDVTRILAQIETGDPAATAQLLPLVYDELRKLAAARLAHEQAGQTLQATALVHEAYVRLVGSDIPSRWEHRGHFFAAAAEAMRRILVDAARRRRSLRRGGDARRVTLADDDLAQLDVQDDWLDLHEALARLEAVDSEAAAVVKLRVFAGLSIDEIAGLHGVSSRTVKRNWAYARAWLGRALGTAPPAGP